MTDQPQKPPQLVPPAPPKKKKGGFWSNLANAVVRIVLSPLGAFEED